MPVAGSPRSSFVAKLPSVQTTRGAISSSWRNRYSWQFSISCGSGSRLPGGRQRRTLRDEDVAARQPDLARAACRAAGRPGRRTGRPACPRWRRAPRRRTSGRRRRCPSRTRPSCASAASCGQRVQSRACLPDRLELLAPLLRGEHAATCNPPPRRHRRHTPHLRRSMLSDEAATFRDGPRTRPTPRSLAAGIPCGNWTRAPSPSWAQVASAPPWPPPCAPPASTSTARSAAARRRRRTPRSCSASPTPRSPPRPRPIAARAARRPLLRRDRARRRSRPHEAFSLHPLMTVPAGARARRLRRRRLRGGGHARRAR